MERSNQFTVTNCICKGKKKPCGWIGFRDKPSMHIGCQQILFPSFIFGHFISTNAYRCRFFIFFNVFNFLKGSLYSTPMQMFLLFSFTILSLTEKKKKNGKRKSPSLHLDGRVLWGFTPLYWTALCNVVLYCCLLFY